MNLIADGGSTKADWILLDDNGKEVLRTRTKGFNPYFIQSDEIIEYLKDNADLQKVADKVKHVYFYGAGCSSKDMNAVLERALAKFFNNANITVDHDLLAAAYAAYNGKPAIVGILGTGSNSCYFDGDKLYEETPSLSYILGDEGSGNNLGKRILRAYFNKKLPVHLSKAFDDTYHLGVNELNKNVYQNQFANSYLASFSEFVATHKNDPYVQRMVYDSLREFLENQVLVYPMARQSEINFIGSIAHVYEDILRSVGAEMHLNIGTVVRRPIDNLIKYHLLYIIPNQEQAVEEKNKRNTLAHD